MKTIYQSINFTFLLLLTGLSSSLFAADPLFLNQGGLDSLYYIFIIGMALVLLFVSKTLFKPPNEDAAGFMVITIGHEARFFPLDESVFNMEPVVKSLADKKTKVYSNLTKITISNKTNKILVEDKNFKNSILINRRRSRRAVLHNDDIIDMGELTLIFIDPNNKEIRSDEDKGRLVRKNQKLIGKVLKSNATLIPSDARLKTFHLTKNITFIGHSETNDLVTKNKMVSLKHAKIERVAGKHKLVDMSSLNGTFVNGRRVNERYLRDGDEIAFESIKYRFSEQKTAR